MKRLSTAVGGEGCEGLRLFHFDLGWSRSQIGNLSRVGGFDGDLTEA